jgi:hypothetical protein
VFAAAQLVRQGKVISLTMPYNPRGPQTGDIRANPLNVMTATGTDYMMGAQNGLPGDLGRVSGCRGAQGRLRDRSHRHAEVRPNEVDLFQRLHIVALVHMGMPFGEICGSRSDRQ